MSIYESLTKIYFSPGGFMPVKKLHELILKEYPEAKLSEVSNWIKKQTINQVTKKSVNEEGAKHGHFFETKPNELHQADLLFFPKDKKNYKYVLCVVDVASRYKAAEALKKKDSNTLVEAFKKIYSETKLKLPKRIIFDKGSEFKGSVTRYFGENGVEVTVSELRYHRSTSIVERFNQTLSKRIFKQLHQKEIEKNKVNNNWFELLKPTVDQINNEPTRLIGIKPNIAIEMEEVIPHPEIKLDSSKKFNIGDIVEYLLI